ncbi:protein-L-isoaspartate O-methyltransferase [Candidatus Woesearchaeota archaeon]|jgi:protein-L-isoaspartate(D-aspartate) O-methyltransferase|nr:protein-L-isoaspartate O-methyltransferase [Candidatus Woesearchaeota archaeon]MBT5740535.1 protein-L-isoaspartate O-methyltransferase [Candidatus Woesearchaeota archaeon]
MSSKETLINQWRAHNVDSDILEAFLTVPREHFVIDSEMKQYAYDDNPLPTLRKQSLSQPTTVIMMLQALQVKQGHRVFEVGSGAGYNATLLAELVGKDGYVVTTEVIPELVAVSRRKMEELDYSNFTVFETDGSEGYLQQAPYDRIIITAACPSFPQPLIDQLKDEGIILAPIGDPEKQQLVKGTKKNGKLSLEFLGPFCFVPMIGKLGFKEIELPNKR